MVGIAAACANDTTDNKDTADIKFRVFITVLTPKLLLLNKKIKPINI